MTISNSDITKDILLFSRDTIFINLRHMLSYSKHRHIVMRGLVGQKKMEKEVLIVLYLRIFVFLIIDLTL
jgi:hypothetical protein